MQCLFEGVAVGIFDIIKTMTTNPLLKDILRRVEIDESRHAAFGVLTMRRLVQDATPEEMIEFEDFAFEILEALNANQQLDMLHDLGPKYGLDPEAVRARDAQPAQLGGASTARSTCTRSCRT